MPPAALVAPPRKVIDPSKIGKYNVKIGDSLKEGNKRLASLKYNHKPGPALNNGRKSTLKPTAGGQGNEVSVEILPNDAAEPPVTFSGVQAPSRKTECVLIYDPATGTFTLEKLMSTFTLNVTSSGAGQHAPLSMPKYKAGQSDDEGSTSESSDGDPTKADPENPFDYRHFINKKFEVPTSSSRLRDDKTRKQRLEKFHDELSDPNASSDSHEEEGGDLILDDPPTAPPPVKQTAMPARPRAAPTKPRAKPAPKTPSTKKFTTPISLGSAAKKGNVLTPPSQPVQTPQTGNKRPREEHVEESSESDADDESEESDEDEEARAFTGSGELIVEGEEENNRNNRSRSTTAGLGTSWTGSTRGGPINLSRVAVDVDMDSDEDGDDDHHRNHPAAPSPYQQPVSLSGLGGGHRNLDEDEESSDEDEDEEPRHRQQYQQQQHLVSAPTPTTGRDEEEEEEDEEAEFDLEQALESALENEDDIPSVPVGGPMSLGGMRDEESTSEEE